MYCAVELDWLAGEWRSARTARIVLKRYRPVCCEIMYESPSLLVARACSSIVVSLECVLLGECDSEEGGDAPGDLREVVGVERREPASERVAVSAARAAALLDRVARHDGRQRLEPRRTRVHVGEERKVALLERGLARVVRRHHGPARVVQRKGLHQGREDARLHEEVVEDLRLGRLAPVVRLGRVAVGKLPPDGAVTDRDRRRAREDHAGLLHNVGADEGLRCGKWELGLATCACSEGEADPK